MGSPGIDHCMCLVCIWGWGRNESKGKGKKRKRVRQGVGRKVSDADPWYSSVS